jgi:hypothetical protein
MGRNRVRPRFPRRVLVSGFDHFTFFERGKTRLTIFEKDQSQLDDEILSDTGGGYDDQDQSQPNCPWSVPPDTEAVSQMERPEPIAELGTTAPTTIVPIC